MWIGRPPVIGHRLDPMLSVAVRMSFWLATGLESAATGIEE